MFVTKTALFTHYSKNMDSTRQNKISRLIQKEMGDILLKEGKGQLIGKMITVTSVRISPDLSLARVYVSLFPPAERKEILEVINSQTKHLRHELGIRVKNQLRIVPELAFFIDDSLDYIENIDRLLKK
jgi:ribosome-binding factor A